MLGQGSAKYGYRWNADRTGYVANYEPVFTDEVGYVWSEATVVEFVFAQLLGRVSQRKIAFYLNELGVPARKGGTWSQSKIKNIARDPQYTGRAYAFKLTKVNGRDVKRPPEEQILLPDGTIPPLVSNEDFTEVQQILKENKAFSARNNGMPQTSLLRSLCKCGVCGYTMHVQRAPNRSDLYFCHHKNGKAEEDHSVAIITHAIDEKAWEVALSYITDPCLLQIATLGLLSKLQEDTETQAIVEQQLTEMKRKFTNLWVMAENCTDNDTLNTLTAKLKELEQEKRRLESYQQTLMEEASLRERIEKEIKRFEQWAQQVRPLLSDSSYTPTYEEKRLAVLILGITARVWPSKGVGVQTDYPYRFKIEVAPPNILKVFSEHGLSISL